MRFKMTKINLLGIGIPEAGYCVGTDGNKRGTILYVDKDEMGESHLVVAQGKVSLVNKTAIIYESRWAENKKEWDWAIKILIREGLLKSKDELYDVFLN